jgi:Holliday junction resolvasome RuvABC endonuclease subunit
MNKLLAIDQSLTCTAWCIFEGERYDRLTSFGTIKTSKKDGDLYQRVFNISSQLKEIFFNNNIPDACREGLSFGGRGNATRDLAYLVGAIESQCQRPFLEVPPKSAKKFATGNGNASKQDMIDNLPPNVMQRFMEENYKKTTGLADLADSYFIGKYWIEYLTRGKDK